MPKQEYACETCSAKFDRWPSQIRNRIFCSQKCVTTKPTLKTGRNVRCEACCKQFYKQKHAIDKSDRSYCSAECRSDGKRMQAVMPMIGQRYHQLTVLKMHRNDQVDSYVLCKCECGNQKVIRAVYLRNGHTKSCGHCKGKTLSERFHNRIIKDEGGCWLWNGRKSKSGYGMITDKGKERLAHRLSYELYKGSLSNKFICHSCDRPECVNPDHLWEGTAKDNAQDMSRKGRVNKTRKARGSRHVCAKLTEADVFMIRELHKGGEGLRDMALHYAVSVTTIYDIVKLRTWKHLL